MIVANDRTKGEYCQIKCNVDYEDLMVSDINEDL